MSVEVTFADSPTQVILDDDGNIQILQLATQGPEGPPGASSGNSVIRTVAVNTVMTAADATLRVDSTSGNITISLPSTAVTYDPVAGTGQVFNVAKFIDANQVIVNCSNGSDTINGGSSVTIYLQGNLQVQAGPNNTYTVL